jgi:hypothetical protein
MSTDSQNDSKKSATDSFKDIADTFREKIKDIALPEDFKNGLTGQDLAQSKYNFSSLVFPNDIGFDTVGHYMVININVPTKIDQTTPAGIFSGDQFTPLEPIQRSKVDVLRYGIAATYTNGGKTYGPATPYFNLSNSPNAPFFNVPRFTRRIEQSIAVYMPTPLIFNSQHAYEEISLTKLAGKLTIGALAGTAFATAFWGSLAGGLTKAARVIADTAGKAVGSSTISSIAKLTGNPINPMAEIVFASTQVRQFAFELLMAPRNEKESISIREIVKTLRFHSAPEINTNTYGFTWIPPAEFDITFFNKGVENVNMIRINTCVLERIEVDYAPSAGTFSTFRNGHPVAVRLSLGFRELEPIHKMRVVQGF